MEKAIPQGVKAASRGSFSESVQWGARVQQDVRRGEAGAVQWGAAVQSGAAAPSAAIFSLQPRSGLHFPEFPREWASPLVCLRDFGPPGREKYSPRMA